MEEAAEALVDVDADQVVKTPSRRNHEVEALSVGTVVDLAVPTESGVEFETFGAGFGRGSKDKQKGE